MERVELTRDCEGVQIPAGNRITLEKGVEVFITQSLGGTYTVQAQAYGGLFRIAGADADNFAPIPEPEEDLFGLDQPEPPADAEVKPSLSTREVIEQAREHQQFAARDAQLRRHQGRVAADAAQLHHLGQNLDRLLAFGRFERGQLTP